MAPLQTARDYMNDLPPWAKTAVAIIAAISTILGAWQYLPQSAPTAAGPDAAYLEVHREQLESLRRLERLMESNAKATWEVNGNLRELKGELRGKTLTDNFGRRSAP